MRRRLDAGIGRGLGIVAHGAQLVAPAACARGTPRRATQQASASRSDRLSGEARSGCRPARALVHARQLPTAAKSRLSRRHRARRDQHVHQQIDHQRRGDEVEHDGGDDDVAAALGLQPGRHRGPGGAEQRPPRRSRAAISSHAGRYAVEREDDEADAQPAEIGLALAADVEQAGMEGDRHREAGEDEVGGVVERVADRLRTSRTRPKTRSAQRVRADRRRSTSTMMPTIRKASATLISGSSADVGPARQAAARRAHAAPVDFARRGAGMLGHHQAERALVGAAARAPRRRCGRRTSPGCGRRATGSRRARPRPPARRSRRRGSRPAGDG